MALSSHSSFMLLLLLLLWPLLVKSLNNTTIPFGSPLTASETQQNSSSWRSPSGDFAFGFRRIEPNKDFLPSIWFDKIQDKTIVWYANLTVPEGSNIVLTRRGGLVLTDPQGRKTNLAGESTGFVSRGVMTDAGNLVLEDENSNELWSSFANPTDTLLPTQVMEANGLLRSRRSETNFTAGRFRLLVQEDGNLVLKALNRLGQDSQENDKYFSTENPYNTSNSGSQLIFNHSGNMYILTRNNSRFNLTPGDKHLSEDYYHRAVLHFDGVFIQYFHPKTQDSTGDNNTGWSSVWKIPGNICKQIVNRGSVACGFNSICSLDEDQRPKCECPKMFSPVDVNDLYGDCKPDFDMYPCRLDDDENRTLDDLYDFIRLQGTNWPTSNYDLLLGVDEKGCRDNCLQDCLCAAVINGDTGCWKKKYPLSNGISPASDTVALIKVPKDESPSRESYNRSKNSNGKKENHKVLIITISVLLGTSVIINFILAFPGGTLVSLFCKKRSSRILGGETVIKSNLRVYNYRELVEATGEFNEELGRGAFGIVYKGFIKTEAADDEFEVAVKKLDRVMQEGEKEFKNEVNVIGQTHHKNLVKLFGFCNEGQNRLLVYEFLPNGTLANFLFRYPKPSWKERKRIALGIARGILYLHEECSTQIIHCDIKPQNILLDECYNARISDFGLAKLLMMNQTHTRTGIRGTKGYVALEWFRNKPITAKVDIYSYGVLLLEIICCKKAVDPEDNVILTDWVYDFFRKGTLINLIEGDSEAIEDMETVERYVRTAIWCIQEEPERRPSMRRVTQMLEGVIEVGTPPNPSAYADSVSLDAN